MAGNNYKKVLIIATLAKIGGVAVFVRDLAKELKKRNIDITIGFGEGRFLPEELDKLNINWRRFKHLKRSHNPLINFKFFVEFKKYLKENNFSTIHINSSNALLSAIVIKKHNKNIKTVFTVHGLSLLDENYRYLSFLKLIYKIYFKNLFKFVDELIFVSQHNLTTAQEHKLCQNGTVILNGIDQGNINFIDKTKAREIIAGSIDNNIDWVNSFILGSIGRLSYQKNYDFLIKAFPSIIKINPNFKLIIIGDGPDKNKLKKFISYNNLKNHIFFTGPIPNASKLIKAFDLFLLPSRYEGLPLTLLEALAAGTPALASAVGGNSELLSPEQLFRPDDRTDFLAKLKVLAKDQDLRNELSRKNREQSKRFTIGRMADEYLDLY